MPFSHRYRFGDLAGFLIISLSVWKLWRRPLRVLATVRHPFRMACLPCNPLKTAKNLCAGSSLFSVE
jgi:hypothetical protein